MEAVGSVAGENSWYIGAQENGYLPCISRILTNNVTGRLSQYQIIFTERLCHFCTYYASLNRLIRT